MACTIHCSPFHGSGKLFVLQPLYGFQARSFLLLCPHPCLPALARFPRLHLLRGTLICSKCHIFLKRESCLSCPCHVKGFDVHVVPLRRFLDLDLVSKKVLEQLVGQMTLSISLPRSCELIKSHRYSWSILWQQLESGGFRWCRTTSTPSSLVLQPSFVLSSNC